MEIDVGGWIIRSWDAGDAKALAMYANNRNIWINVRDSFPHPYTLEDAQLSIYLAGESDPEIRLAIANSEEAIGSIGLSIEGDVHRRSAEIGYWIAEPYWGKGIATKVVLAFTDYAFQHFDLVRIYGEVFEGNEASVRVLKKAGYTFEGRMRKSITKEGLTLDSTIYAVIR